MMRIKQLCVLAAVALVSYWLFRVASGSIKLLMVLSGSMVPIMQVGDVIVVERASPEDIKLGEILAFKDPRGTPNTIITHRVVGISEDKGLSFKTKGDAVEDADKFTVTSDMVIGKAVFSLPSFGRLARYSKTPAVLLLLNIFPAALLILGEVRKINRQGRPGLVCRAMRAEKRNNRRITRIKWGMLASVFLVAALFSAAVSLPYLGESGVESIRDGKSFENRGMLPAILVLRSMEASLFFPPMVVEDSASVKIGDTLKHHVDVSMAPYIMPVFWADILARESPYLPSAVSLVFPPALLVCLAYPLWLKKIPPRRGRTLKGLLKRIARRHYGRKEEICAVS